MSLRWLAVLSSVRSAPAGRHDEVWSVGQTVSSHSSQSGGGQLRGHRGPKHRHSPSIRLPGEQRVSLLHYWCFFLHFIRSLLTVPCCVQVSVRQSGDGLQLSVPASVSGRQTAVWVGGVQVPARRQRRGETQTRFLPLRQLLVSAYFYKNPTLMMFRSTSPAVWERLQLLELSTPPTRPAPSLTGETWPTLQLPSSSLLQTLLYYTFLKE